MRLKMGGLTESLLTRFTLEWLLPRVDTLMSLQV